MFKACVALAPRVHTAIAQRVQPLDNWVKLRLLQPAGGAVLHCIWFRTSPRRLNYLTRISDYGIRQ